MMAIKRLLKTSAFRLSAIYILLITLALVIIGYMISWQTNQLITSQIKETVKIEIRALSDEYRRGGAVSLARTIAERANQPGRGLYYFGNDAGLKISGNLSEMPVIFLKKFGTHEFTYLTSRKKGARSRAAVGVPFKLRGGVQLLVARDIQDQKDFSHQAAKIFFSGLGLIALFVLGTGIYMGRRLLRKVEAVNETTSLIMAGDLSERLPVDGSGDEIDRLSKNVNVMLGKIEKLMTGLKQVSDNIAHDLKTPLNRLRNKAEAGLLEHDDPKAAKQSLTQVIEESDRLINVFESLLKIARLEAAGTGKDLHLVSLKAVADEVVELYEPVIEDHNFQLISHLKSDFKVKADRQLLAQAVSNLIDNGLKYGADTKKTGTKKMEGELSLYLEKETIDNQTFAVLSVGDRGAGIAPKDRRRVLERFVRLDESRTKQGSGLGLSMVGAIMEAFDGHVELKDHKPGLLVCLYFPLI